MTPPFRNEESWPPKRFFVEESHVWLILWLPSVASWRHKIILVMKGKYIMDGSAYFLCLNNIAMPGQSDLQTLRS